MHRLHKDKSQEYRNGFDAGKNGTNLSNTNYSNFRSVATRNDWAQGFKNGKRAKGREENKPFMIGGVEYEVLKIDYRPN